MVDMSPSTCHLDFSLVMSMDEQFSFLIALFLGRNGDVQNYVSTLPGCPNVNVFDRHLAYPSFVQIQLKPIVRKKNPLSKQ